MAELEKKITIDSYFIQLLNLAFKKILEGDDSNFLNNFETSVIFIIKRKELFTNHNLEQFYSKAEENHSILKKLNDEVNYLKNEFQKLKSQTDIMNEKLNNSPKNSKVSSKKSTRISKNFCSIC